MAAGSGCHCPAIFPESPGFWLSELFRRVKQGAKPGKSVQRRGGIPEQGAPCGLLVSPTAGIYRPPLFCLGWYIDLVRTSFRDCISAQAGCGGERDVSWEPLSVPVLMSSLSGFLRGSGWGVRDTAPCASKLAGRKSGGRPDSTRVGSSIGPCTSAEMRPCAKQRPQLNRAGAFRY